MSLNDSDDVAAALAAAEENGWLHVLVTTDETSDAWEAAVSDWVTKCHDDWRAAIAVFEDHTGRATVQYVAPSTTHVVGPKLERAGTKLASRHVDGAGFADGPFGSWGSRKCELAVAIELAKKLRYLDRFARRTDAAAAYEDGLGDDWGIVADVMES